MPKTLLLADDSVTIQKVVGITFANEDVTLVTVDNGDDAIVRARQIKPDCVLADVSMPGLSGYELCAAIRAEPELAQIPVLLLTGTFETYDSQRAIDAGADGYIAKPFEAQALVERVRALLAKPRAVAPPAPKPVVAAPKPVLAAPKPVPPTPQRPLSAPATAPTPPRPFAAPVVARPTAPPPPPSPAFDDIPDEQPTVFAAPAELDEAEYDKVLPTRIFEPADHGADTPTADPLFGDKATDGGESTDPASEPSGDLFEESSFPDPNAGALSVTTDLDTEPIEPDALADEEPDTTRDQPHFREEPAWAQASASPPARAPEAEDPDLPWAEALELDEPESDDSLAAADFAPREPARERSRPQTQPETRPGLAPAVGATQSPLPALDPRVLREALEKVAWEAFGPLSEQIVRDVVARVEAIAWEVVPQLAERLIREEIAALKREPQE